MQKVPQWYGETIGFWDGTTLISWTANVQAWTLTHSMFEISGKIETIEIVTPAYDASGAFTGINHETIFYDPDVFVAPVRATMFIRRFATPADPNPRFSFVECLSNIRNVNEPSNAADAWPPRLHRLLRPSLGEELGEVFRSGLGQAAGRTACGDHRHLRKIAYRDAW